MHIVLQKKSYKKKSDILLYDLWNFLSLNGKEQNETAVTSVPTKQIVLTSITMSTRTTKRSEMIT